MPHPVITAEPTPAQMRAWLDEQGYADSDTLDGAALREVFAAMRADASDPCPVFGALWPCASDSDDSRPYVERYDALNVFASDDDAARAVADAVGGIVVYALLHDDHARGRWQPAVYPMPIEAMAR